jgi:acyl carrier protein
MTRDAILQLIRASLDDVNAERDERSRIPFSEDLPLHGTGSQLDSLDFVNFTVGLEERLRQHAGGSPDLAAVLFDPSQPFRSAASLADHLASA